MLSVPFNRNTINIIFSDGVRGMPGINFKIGIGITINNSTRSAHHPPFYSRVSATEETGQSIKKIN